MAVDMSNVKQIMHNNKEVIKIEDSLGHIIWQKSGGEKQITITYLMGMYISQTPVTKTVTTTGGVYSLTSEDLPTLTLATGYTTDGWTTNGSTRLTAGTQISDDIILKAIHKVTVSKTYDWTSSGFVFVGYRKAKTASCSHNTTLYGLNTAQTETYTNSYSHYYKNTMYSWDVSNKVAMRGFNGQIVTFQIKSGVSFKIHWSPETTSVTYTKSSGWDQGANYGDVFPMILVRDGNTTTKLYTNSNVTANTVTETITAGSTNNAYLTFQYGGWDEGGGGKTAWIGQYYVGGSDSSISYPSSNKTGNRTDNIYIYVQ